MEKPGRSRALLWWRRMSNNFESHHRQSIRLQGYDYSQPGMYFVTIGVEERTCLFGEVVKGKMILDQAGQIDEEELRRIREYIRTNPLRWELDRENPARRGEDEFDCWLASLSKRGNGGEK